MKYKRLWSWNFNTSHVTVYQRRGPYYDPPYGISIHLMLLFINKAIQSLHTVYKFQYISCYCFSLSDCCCTTQRTIFQYISCYCLSCQQRGINMQHAYFNTSHVTVYRNLQFNSKQYSCISIHLMLLFILSVSILAFVCGNFNTSHVTVYPLIPRFSWSVPSYFNTSHVTVYLFQCNKSISFYTFQYISCYCLSFLYLFCIHQNLHFNTSHVTVYLHQFRHIRRAVHNFNTSHVTVYLAQHRETLTQFANFNTSHVTVYRISKHISCCAHIISIHLMLLFIIKGD